MMRICSFWLRATLCRPMSWSGSPSPYSGVDELSARRAAAKPRTKGVAIRGLFTRRDNNRIKPRCTLDKTGKPGHRQLADWRELDSNFRFRAPCKGGLRRSSTASGACRRRYYLRLPLVEISEGGPKRNLGTEALSREEPE